jgi:hypothetical protein
MRFIAGKHLGINCNFPKVKNPVKYFCVIFWLILYIKAKIATKKSLKLIKFVKFLHRINIPHEVIPLSDFLFVAIWIWHSISQCSNPYVDIKIQKKYNNLFLFSRSVDSITLFLWNVSMWRGYKYTIDIRIILKMKVNREDCEDSNIWKKIIITPDNRARLKNISPDNRRINKFW